MEIITANRSPIYKDTDDSNEDRIQSEYFLDAVMPMILSYIQCLEHGDTNANRIKQIVDHKSMLILLVILGLVAMAANGNIFGDSIISNTIMLSIVSLWIRWFIFKYLLFNKVTFKLCLQTFDFWIKICYGVLFCIAKLFHDQPPEKQRIRSMETLQHIKLNRNIKTEATENGLLIPPAMGHQCWTLQQQNAFLSYLWFAAAPELTCLADYVCDYGDKE
eukprot:756301_1